MDQPAPINAIDSSVSSLTTSFGQLNVDACTGDGPINLLPNEMMQLIMVKLGLDKDVKKLIRLRLLSTRWRAMVEDYCRLKKSLFVQFDPYQAISDCTSHYFEETFFGFANSTHFTCLFLSTKISSECLSSLLNMFPNIEQLSIYCYDYYYVNGKYYESTALHNSLQVYINSLDSLKLLDLNVLPIAAKLSPAILSKLEHFSYNHFSWHNDDLLRAIAHLGQGCVCVNFRRNDPFVYEQIRQLLNINPAWLANLTYLQMSIQRSTSEECARVVHLLSENAILLKYLDLHTLYDVLKLTPTVLEDLAKLTHLTNLTFHSIKMHFSELAQSASHHRSTSLSSVLTCKLWARIDDDILDYSISGDQFTRVLSVIFPNLADLNFTFEVDMENVTRRNELRHEMERHLARFSNLRKHKINFLKF